MFFKPSLDFHFSKTNADAGNFEGRNSPGRRELVDADGMNLKDFGDLLDGQEGIQFSPPQAHLPASVRALHLP